MDQSLEKLSVQHTTPPHLVNPQALEFSLHHERIGPIPECTVGENIERLKLALDQGVGLSPPIKGLFGRLLRGSCESDFLSLTDEPDRRIVFLLDSEGLSELPGKSGYEMLIHVGHTPTDIYRRVVEQGKQFKLAVFALSQAVRLADWQGVIETVSEAYPEHAPALTRNRFALEHFSLAEIEKQAGFKFSDVTSADPRYMSSQRFAQSEQGFWQTRAFLYHVVHLRDLYRGDGYTYNENGQRGAAEYMIPNLLVEQLESSFLFDIDVRPPDF